MSGGACVVHADDSVLLEGVGPLLDAYVADRLDALTVLGRSRPGSSMWIAASARIEASYVGPQRPSVQA